MKFIETKMTLQTYVLDEPENSAKCWHHSSADGAGVWKNPNDKRPFKCSFCTGCYKSKSSLYGHVSYSHNGANNGPRLRFCKKCRLSHPSQNFNKGITIDDVFIFYGFFYYTRGHLKGSHLSQRKPTL